MAGARLRGERRDHTLSGTALVHEAYLKLIESDRSGWRDKARFYAIAAIAMRQVLVDSARRKRARKRGGGEVLVALDDKVAGAVPTGGAAGAPSDGDARAVEVLALDEALRRLETKDPRQARVVVCRFFGGMEVGETAAALGISEATVKRDWTLARAWLNRELRSGQPTGRGFGAAEEET
jgi:RNA polymerase sigma factor (TIGR02999 family)